MYKPASGTNELRATEVERRDYAACGSLHSIKRERVVCTLRARYKATRSKTCVELSVRVAACDMGHMWVSSAAQRFYCSAIKETLRAWVV